MNLNKKWVRGLLAAFGLLGVASAAHAQLDYSAYGVADFSYGRFEPSGFEPGLLALIFRCGRGR